MQRLRESPENAKRRVLRPDFQPREIAAGDSRRRGEAILTQAAGRPQPLEVASKSSVHVSIVTERLHPVRGSVAGASPRSAAPPSAEARHCSQVILCLVGRIALARMRIVETA